MLDIIILKSVSPNDARNILFLSSATGREIPSKKKRNKMASLIIRRF